MQIQNNAQILVIDDHYEEVKNVLSCLTKNGLSYIHNDGSEDQRPVNKYLGVRFVILDIDLEGRTSGITSDATKASTLVTYLEEIISDKNGPLFILFCTKNEDVIRYVKKYFASSSLVLAGCDSLEKDANGIAGDVAIEKLNEAVQGSILPDTFRFFLSWEQQVDVERTSFIRDLVSFQQGAFEVSSKKDLDKRINDWNELLKKILCNFAVAYTGQRWKEIQSDERVPLFALRMLNSCFKDKLPQKAELFNVPTTSITIPIECVAKINKSLFMEKIDDDKRVDTGRVFYDEDESLLDALKEIILRNEEPIEVKLLTVVITPQCDLAHPRYLSLKNVEDEADVPLHRIVRGIEIEISDKHYEKLFQKAGSYQEKLDFIKQLNISDGDKATLNGYISAQSADYLFKTFPIENNSGKKCVWIFHFATVSTIPIKREQRFDYQLSKELIFDLQSKLANHVNRLGNSMLEC